MTQKPTKKSEKTLTLSDLITIKEVRTIRNKKTGKWGAELPNENGTPLVEAQGPSKNEAIRALFEKLARPHRYLTYMAPILLEDGEQRVLFWQRLDGQFCYGFLDPGQRSPRYVHQEGTDRIQAERAMRRHFASNVWASLPRIEWERTHGADDPYVSFDPKHYAHDITVWESHWLSPYIQDEEDQREFVRSVMWQCAHRWAMMQGYTKEEAHAIASENFGGVLCERHLALGNPVLPNRYRRSTQPNSPMIKEDTGDEKNK